MVDAGAGGGEANTYSSPAGSGTSYRVIRVKLGVDLPHKNIVEGTNITIDSTATTVTINATGGGNHDILSATHPDATVGAVARGDLIVGQTATPAWTKLALGASGTIPRSDGTDLLYSTATYPNTTTINRILFSSAANVIGEIATANNQILNTNGSGVPSFTATLPNAVQDNIIRLGTITLGVWNGTALLDAAVDNGITLNNITQVTTRLITSLTATNWRTFASNGSGSVVELANVAAGNVLRAGGTTALPNWGTVGEPELAEAMNFTPTGNWDWSTGIRGMPRGTTVPATCAIGDEFMDTDATSGQRHFLCEATNTWVLQGDGTGGGSALVTEFDGVSQSTDTKTYDFSEGGTGDFTIVESPADDFDVTINRTISAAWNGIQSLSRAGIAYDFQNSTDAVSNEVVRLQGADRATAANNDESYIGLRLENDTAAQVEAVRLVWVWLDIADASKDSRPEFHYWTGNTLRKLSFPAITVNDVVVVTTLAQTLANKILTTPTIASMVNATHDHQAAAGGGVLDVAAVTTGVFSVARGGSGAGTFTANGALYGNTTSAFQVTAAHTANGSLLIGDGSGVPTVATITAGNRIQITNSAGGITIASADSGEIQIPAVLKDTTLTNGSLDFLETGAYRIDYWEYAASTQDTLLLKCSVGFSLPQDFGSFIDAYFEYENESTGADTLILRMEGIAHNEVHAADLTIGSAPDTLVSATGPAANDLRQSTLQSTITGTFAAKDHIHLILYRPATDAGVMRYFKLIFRYLKS